MVKGMRTRLLFTRRCLRTGNSVLWGAVCAAIGFYAGATFMTDSTDAEFKSLAQQLASLRAWEAKVGRGEEKLKFALNQLMARTHGAPSSMRARALTDQPVGIGGGRERHSVLFSNDGSPDSFVEEALETTRVGEASDHDAVFHGGDLTGLSLIVRSLPLGFPVDGPISSGFGQRVSPISGTLQRHTGIDFSVHAYTPVHATGEGVVTEAGYKGDYGQTIVVDHGLGVRTLYAHLSAIQVRVGERIERGRLLGLTGSTGHSTGPHLHYEVRVNETPQNPARFLDFPFALNGWERLFS